MADIQILFEDSSIIVADKPSGLLTVATPKKEKHTLSALLKAAAVHRLDRETSGLIVLAKTEYASKAMMDAFRRRQVKKRYIAFVRGRLARKSAGIHRYVQDNPYEPAKFAHTKYRVLEENEFFSVVEVVPITGRTNQIRIHFRQIGHPLLGERRFAFARDFKLKFKRVALHASDIEFKHPLSGKRLCFHSGLPVDMRNFLKKPRHKEEK